MDGAISRLDRGKRPFQLARCTPAEGIIPGGETRGKHIADCTLCKRRVSASDAVALLIARFCWCLLSSEVGGDFAPGTRRPPNDLVPVVMALQPTLCGADEEIQLRFAIQRQPGLALPGAYPADGDL